VFGSDVSGHACRFAVYLDYYSRGRKGRRKKKKKKKKKKRADMKKE